MSEGLIFSINSLYGEHLIFILIFLGRTSCYQARGMKWPSMHLTHDVGYIAYFSHVSCVSFGITPSSNSFCVLAQL